jgi:uncharacterized SAM-binding protein YcdF (DUF218 family)
MQNYFNWGFLVLYVVGIFFIPRICRKVKSPHWLLWEFAWTALLFFFYVLFLEFQAKTYFFFIPCAFFSLFAFFYFREKRRLVNGLLFNLFLVSLALYLGMLMYQTHNLLLILLAGASLIAILLAGLFGIYALIIFLYWNGIVVLRKEGRSLANLLTLFLAILLTCFLIYDIFGAKLLPSWLTTLLSIVPFLLTYFFVVFYNFLTVSVLYQFNRPRYTQDYIVVLGAGLLNGETVTPLLKARIDKAIQFYQSQTLASLSSPILLMSGGQGPDEKRPESIAMKEYALTQGIPEKDLLVETNSKNTLENMRFSKEIMVEHFGSDQFKAIFATNNYHLFRAGLFAKMAHLKADGIGAKTAFYFLPNAFLREYIAVLVMNKRRHLIVCGVVVVFMTLAAIANFFLVS